MEKRVGLQLPHRKRLRAETRMGFLLHSRQHPDLNWTKEPVRAGEVKQFPFRVKCCPDGPEVRLPFFPEQRTSTDRLGWSGLSHIRTCTQQGITLRLLGQMKPASHLPVNRSRRAISEFLVSCSVQSYSHRKMTVVLSNKLDAANGFTTGPLSNSIEALFSERDVAHPRGCEFRQ